jgi:hypothetical protein
LLISKPLALYIFWYFIDSHKKCLSGGMSRCVCVCVCVSKYLCVCMYVDISHSNTELMGIIYIYIYIYIYMRKISEIVINTVIINFNKSDATNGQIHDKFGNIASSTFGQLSLF